MHQWEHLLWVNLYASDKSQLPKLNQLAIGSNDGFDKLTLEILTEWDIIPEDALGLSARILTEHLNLFTNLTEIATTNECYERSRYDF